MGYILCPGLLSLTTFWCFLREPECNLLGRVFLPCFPHTQRKEAELCICDTKLQGDVIGGGGAGVHFGRRADALWICTCWADLLWVQNTVRIKIAAQRLVVSAVFW